jgi:Fe-S oxidoreductase
MTTVNPIKDAVDAILEAGGKSVQSCYQCGLCSGTCPWNMVRDFLSRRIMHQAQIGLVELEKDETWLCAACGACVERCPRGVKLIDVMTAVRRIAQQYGTPPKALKTALTSISAVGNPWGEPSEERADWAKNLGVKQFTIGTEWLYFPCCTPVYDKRRRRIAVATVNILQKAGIDFGILGSEETCCGESARKSGAEELFQRSVTTNTGVFKRYGIRKILVSSPHCYHTFINEYSELSNEVEVVHITQFLASMIKKGKITPVKNFNKVVAYHDSCYLGRHNKIYEEPRMVLESIHGLKLVELPDNRAGALCCGGGGGRIWMETKKEERFSDIRLQQAIDAGAGVLAVACPYCMVNFDDSLLTMNKENELEVKDITEVVSEVI